MRRACRLGQASRPCGRVGRKGLAGWAGLSPLLASARFALDAVPSL